jgi:hypothetical protein
MEDNDTIKGRRLTDLESSLMSFNEEMNHYIPSEELDKLILDAIKGRDKAEDKYWKKFKKTIN